MDDINYRCPECGGKLIKTEIEPGLIVRECEGCKAIYELTDPAALTVCFSTIT